MFKEKLSRKKIKNLKNMLFIKRTHTYESYHSITEVCDYFFHTVKQVTVIRKLIEYSGCKPFVHWTCPELGGGNAGLGYWLNMEKTQDKKETFYEG